MRDEEDMVGWVCLDGGVDRGGVAVVLEEMEKIVESLGRESMDGWIWWVGLGVKKFYYLRLRYVLTNTSRRSAFSRIQVLSSPSPPAQHTLSMDRSATALF